MNMNFLTTNATEFGLAMGVAMSLTELAKATFPTLSDDHKRFVPVISVAIGGLMGYLFKFDAITCLLVGLSASGLYSGVKTGIKNE